MTVDVTTATFTKPATTQYAGLELGHEAVKSSLLQQLEDLRKDTGAVVNEYQEEKEVYEAMFERKMAEKENEVHLLKAELDHERAARTTDKLDARWFAAGAVAIGRLIKGYSQFTLRSARPDVAGARQT